MKKDTKPIKKNGLEDLIKLIEDKAIEPEIKYVPFYDDNGRPLHFVKPKKTDKK